VLLPHIFIYFPQYNVESRTVQCQKAMGARI
jgi:hypothetical protein